MDRAVLPDPMPLHAHISIGSLHGHSYRHRPNGLDTL